MPRGQYERKKQTTTSTDVAVRPEVFSHLSWWKKLNPQEQQAVLHESQELGAALLNYGQARLAVGQHLERLQSLLEPHNVFQKFLKTFRFSKRTAYRYIAGYKNATAMLPPPVVKAAMVRGVPIVGESDIRPLGVYTDIVKTLPPPQSPTEEQANAYIDAIEKMRRDLRSTATVLELPVGDPNTLLNESLRFVSTRYKRLPQNKRTRDAWVTRFLGMCLSQFGVTNGMSVIPLAVPAELQVKRGRPAIEAKIATA